MSTFLRYLKFQAMMFVFGIVGPIFLVLYFGSQPDPTMKWAFWAVLFLTAADVLIALALTDAAVRTKAPVGGRLNVKMAGRARAGHDARTDSPSSVFEPFAAAGFPSNDSWSTSSDFGSSSN